MYSRFCVENNGFIVCSAFSVTGSLANIMTAMAFEPPSNIIWVGPRQDRHFLAKLSCEVSKSPQPPGRFMKNSVSLFAIFYDPRIILIGTGSLKIERIKRIVNIILRKRWFQIGKPNTQEYTYTKSYESGETQLTIWARYIIKIHSAWWTFTCNLRTFHNINYISKTWHHAYSIRIDAFT